VNKRLFAPPKEQVLHPLAYLGQARMANERKRLLSHNQTINKSVQEDFERKISCNLRKTEALQRSLDAQARIGLIMEARQLKAAQDAAKDKSMGSLMAAKLAGPREVMRAVCLSPPHRLTASPPSLE